MRRAFAVGPSLVLFALAAGPAFAQTGTGDTLAPDAVPPLPPSVRVQQLQEVEDTDHFSISPTRYFLQLKPLQQQTIEIALTNREGRATRYDILVEDFDSDETREFAPRFYGTDENGPYPARNWIVPAATSIVLEHGQRAFIPLVVTVPGDAEPGDHQAAVVIERHEATVGASGISVKARAASLAVITVEGEAREEGGITDFRPLRRVFFSMPATLVLEGTNDGTVHIAPEGTMTIRNVFGVPVHERRVADWFILRGSTRPLALTWDAPFAFGRYTATADLVLKTYGNTLPNATVSTSFWVIPLLPFLVLLFVILLLSFLVQLFLTRFEISFKRKDASHGGKR